MSTKISNFNDYYKGKGNRRNQYGRKVKIQKNGDSLHKKISTTPNDKAIRKLQNYLKNKEASQILESHKDDPYQDKIGKLKSLEQLRTMNMKTLGQVLIFLHNNNYQLNVETFYKDDKEALPYINVLINDFHKNKLEAKQLQDNKLEVVRLRFAATFLRYSTLVLESYNQTNLNQSIGQVQQDEQDQQVDTYQSYESEDEYPDEEK